MNPNSSTPKEQELDDSLKVEPTMSPLDPYADWHARDDSAYTTPPSEFVHPFTPASSPTGFSQQSQLSGYEYPSATNDILIDSNAFDLDSFAENRKN